VIEQLLIFLSEDRRIACVCILSHVYFFYLFVEAVIGTASRIPFSGQANDIWTAGVTLYVFVHGKVPFLALTSGQTYQVFSVL